MDTRSVEDFAGPWVDQNFESALIDRCRLNWSVPVAKISNYALATFVRQRIALSLVLPEAKRRLATGYTDGTELYDEELLPPLWKRPMLSRQHRWAVAVDKFFANMFRSGTAAYI